MNAAKRSSPRPTVAAFAREFISVYARANNKPSEIRSKESMLRTHLLPEFGRLRLDQIDAHRVERYKAERLSGGLTAKTINNHLAVLRRMLAVATEWNVVGAAPRIKRLRTVEPKFDFLALEEAERLVACAEGEWRTMIAVALKTGLRLGELLALRWDDVNLDRGLLTVRRAASRGIVGTPKSGRNRDVELSAGAVRLLQGHRHSRGELVFCNARGAMWTTSLCRAPMARACRRAGLRLIGWHVLRHTFASHLAMRGVPLRAIQLLLGHSTIAMTERYAHLSPTLIRKAVQRLDRSGARFSRLGARLLSIFGAGKT